MIEHIELWFETHRCLSKENYEMLKQLAKVGGN